MSTQRPGTTKGGVHIERGPNKLIRKKLLDRCMEVGFDPEQAMIEIATGDLVCLTCNGNTETRYVSVDENGARLREADGSLKWNVRLCESCLGTGRERMHVADVLKARQSIFDKIVPSLKQVDNVSSDGSSPRGEMRVVLLGALPEIPKPRIGIPPQLQQKHD